MRWVMGNPYDPDPAGSRELRAAIAAWYARSGIEASTADLVVTASASESYSHIFASRCVAGERVLLPSPGYPLFEDVAARGGLEVDFYHQRSESGWRIDPSEIAALIRPDTSAIVLISPNNPTGSIITDDEIAAIGALCRRHEIFLVVDEVFSEISTVPLPMPAQLLPDLTVYTINGVSKLFAAPDLKVSWVLVSGPDEARAPAVENLLIQNDLFLSASSLSQCIAARMLETGLEYTEWMGREIARRRQTMLEAVARSPYLSAVAPEGGIHLPVQIDTSHLPGTRDDERIAIDLLRDLHLATHPGYLYGLDEGPWLVMSYLPPEERIREGMARIDRYFSSLRSVVR